MYKFVFDLQRFAEGDNASAQNDTDAGKGTADNADKATGQEQSGKIEQAKDNAGTGADKATDKADEKADDGDILNGDDDAESTSNKDNKDNKSETGYQPFAVPEGVEYDEAFDSEFAAVAKELKLTQEQAQKLVDLYGKRYLAGQELQQQTVKSWSEETRKAYSPEDIAIANKAVKRFAPPALREYLKASGAANWMPMVEMFHAIGKAMADAKLVEGKTSGQTDPYAKIYPSMKDM